MNRPPRSSLAIALEDYKGPRPGVALTIAAVLLLAAVVVGVIHVAMLGRAGNAIDDGSETIRTLNGYNAALEVWRQLAVDTGEVTPQEIQMRDSIALSLQRQFSALRAEFEDSTDQRLVDNILDDFTPSDAPIGVRGREALIVLKARQDSAIFQAATGWQRSQYMAALIIGLAVIAAGIMIIPMSWAYVRYKRGVPPGM
ncbi:MAG: hypothetical protein PVH40_05055 [Gemmatimonadales bacterium]|jgi:hypothetical protein